MDLSDRLEETMKREATVKEALTVRADQQKPVRSKDWLGGLRYFVITGPIQPSTVYRLQPNGELELMLSCGWNSSIGNELSGLHEISEGAARFIWERLFVTPNDEVSGRSPSRSNT